MDKHIGVSIFPKATGIRGRTMEIMRSWGLEDQVRAVDMALSMTMAIAETLSQPAQEVSLGLPPLGLSRTVSPTDVAVVPQDYLEPILLDHFHDVGGESRFGTELLSFSMDDDLVRAELRSRDSGDCYQVRARYIVGGDGRRSLVRDQLGVELAPLGMEGRPPGHAVRGGSRAVGESPTLRSARRDETDGRRRVRADRHWPMGLRHGIGVDVPEAAAWWTPERLAERIRTAAGVPDLAMNIEATFRWDFSAAVATRYQYGRAFLVGDAAHGTTPRGATGMNTGIADGHNLGWKLAWVSRGWAHETLLDSYQDERGPVGRRNASRSMESRIGGSAESSLAADFGVTYSSAVIAGGHTGELLSRTSASGRDRVVGLRMPGWTCTASVCRRSISSTAGLRC